MWPVADAFKLKVLCGAEVTAVVPLNLFVPAAMLAVTDTSFQGETVVDLPPASWIPPSAYAIFVKPPPILPDAKSAENAARPSNPFVDRMWPSTEKKALATAVPENVACAVVGMEAAGVSYP